MAEPVMRALASGVAATLALSVLITSLFRDGAQTGVLRVSAGICAVVAFAGLVRLLA